MRDSLSYQTFLLASAKALDVFSMLVLGMLLSRMLMVEDYGTYRQVWLLYYTFIPLFTLGIATSVNYFVPNLPIEKQKTFIFQTFSGLFVLGLVFAVFLYGCAGLFAARFNNPDLAGVIRLFSLVPLLTMPTSYYHNLYICLKKAVQAAVILSIASISRFAAIGISLCFGVSLKNLFLGLLIYYSLEFLLLSLLIFRPFISVPLELKHQNIKEQLQFTVPMGLSSLVGAFSRQIDKLIISSSFTAREFAIYANGAVELPIARVLNSAVISVLMPEMVRLYSHGQYAKLLDLWHRSIRKVSLIIFPIMFFLFVFARETLLFLYSEKYLESTAIFQVYLLTMPPRVTTFGAVLLAAGLTRVIMNYSICTVFFSIVLNVLMIKLWGMWGAALATVISVYFMVFIQLNKICSVLGCSFKQVYPWMLTIRIMTVCFAGCLIPWLLKPLISSWLLSLIINGIIFTSMYLWLCVKTNLISPQELSRFKEKVRSKLSCLRHRQ